MPGAEKFRLHDLYFGQQVQVLEQGVPVCQGKAQGVNEQGAYLIETSSGLAVIQAGDLSLRRVGDA